MSSQNPLSPPKSAVAFFLGGAGGVFGVAFSISIILNPIRGNQIGFSGLDIGAEIFNLSVYFTLPAALVAIFGAPLTLRRLKAGGVLLIAASLVGLLGSIVPVALAYSNPFTCYPTARVGHPEYILFLGELGIWWWVLMILTAGILALVRDREFRKRVANSQAQVNPVRFSSIDCRPTLHSMRSIDSTKLASLTPRGICGEPARRYHFSIYQI
jgi:hypothetical protein